MAVSFGWRRSVSSQELAAMRTPNFPRFEPRVDPPRNEGAGTCNCVWRCAQFDRCDSIACTAFLNSVVIALVMSSSVDTAM